MPKFFRYTAEYPLIFSDLSYGDDVHVAHLSHPLDADESLARAPEEGATVVLYPGDHVQLDETHPFLNRKDDDGNDVPFVHAYLVETDADGKDLEAKDGELPPDPEDNGNRPDYEKKTIEELKGILESRGLTVGGNKPDLIVRVVEADAEADAIRRDIEKAPPAAGEPGSPEAPEGDTRGDQEASTTDGEAPADNTNEKD